ncbi:hypothetical protein RUND412_005659 [Rhizina undulata]
MPLAAATMAGLLFVYTRTSIHAAKANAKLHREADGGQISWRNESLRQHGLLQRPEGGDEMGAVGKVLDRVSTSGSGHGGVAKDVGGAVAPSVDEQDRRIRERAREGKKG